MNGRELAMQAHKFAEERRNKEAAWLQERIEKAKKIQDATAEAKLALSAAMKEFSNNCPGLSFNMDDGVFSIGECKIVKVSVSVWDGNDGQMKKNWYIDVYPCWPKNDRNEEYRFTNEEQFSERFAEVISWFL